MFIDCKWVDTRWQWSFNMLNTRTSTHIIKTPTLVKTHPTYAHPHITKQVKTTTIQDTHQMK